MFIFLDVNEAPIYICRQTLSVFIFLLKPLSKFDMLLPLIKETHRYCIIVTNISTLMAEFKG